MEAICEVFVQEDKKVVWFPNFFFFKKKKKKNEEKFHKCS
jgi:hypothetical protein